MSQELIPYITEARPDTGLTNGKIGIWCFLASEVMLFGAFFASYIVLRTTATEWPHGSSILNVPLATVNTIVLITSSVTMVMAWASLMRNDFGKYRMFLGATVLLGFCFLGIKYVEYSAKFEHHLLPSTNNFLAIYFIMTGLHGLHVIGGMITNAYFLVAAPSYWDHDRALLGHRVEYSGLFWHFVDLVWIFLFPILYLL
ncbi:MAG: cytochrome c oxidase subunit 3 [Deltaproteobacteria bacterium]|nr:cytochrome c oxidase subunit 3 [Deltaproteobacteria bacterium]